MSRTAFAPMGDDLDLFLFLIELVAYLVRTLVESMWLVCGAKPTYGRLGRQGAGRRLVEGVLGRRGRI